MLYEFTVQSSRREEFILITGEINRILAEAGMKNGSCTVFIPHTTAAVTVNECADADVAADLLAFLARLVPASGAYRHREGNSDAHIKAALLGTSLHLIVREGKLDLGTWQGVFLAEFDGPRRRKVKVWA
ncbi:MAG TPA: secondary thiamine-phosphate synthase enzyme YjbQ [Bacillota bacterium]|nr:secondary thiamine-phosphate synthase enzyme YjbQ [Bacillota bacterium]